MSEVPQSRTMTVEEYRHFDERSPLRHEFVAGEVYAMTGATARHGKITMNVATRLFAATRDGPCSVFVNDMRLEAADDRYYYPDVLVVCAPIADSDVIAREPSVVVEVTSPGTGRIDRGEKLDAYRRIPSLLAYLIVDHRRRRIEQHWRAAPGGEWRREEIVAEGRLTVPCVDVELSLEEVYRRVELPAVGEPEPVGYDV